MAEPLTVAERAAIKARHWRMAFVTGESQCGWFGCRRPWPCDAARLLTALAAVEAERDRQADLVAEWQALAEEFRRLTQRRSAEITAPLEPVVEAAQILAHRQAAAQQCAAEFADQPEVCGEHWQAVSAAVEDVAAAVAALAAREEQDG